MHSSTISIPVAPSKKVFATSHRPMISPSRIGWGLLVGIPVAIVVLLTFDWLNQRGLIRHIYPVYLAVAILITPAMTWQNLRALRKPPKHVTEAVHTAKMKLNAEMAAAFALLAFIGPFFKYGADYEKLVPGQQESRLQSITLASAQILSPGYCLRYRERNMACNKVASGLSQLQGQLKEGEEKSAKATIEVLSALLGENAFSTVGGVRRAEIDDLIADLQSFQNPDNGFTKLLTLVLPVLSVLFTCLAVSWKIALAWQDVHKRQRDEQPPLRRRRPGVAYNGRITSISSIARVDNPWR